MHVFKCVTFSLLIFLCNGTKTENKYVNSNLSPNNAEKIRKKPEQASNLGRNNKESNELAECENTVVVTLETQNDIENWRFYDCLYFEDYSELEYLSCVFRWDNTVFFRGIWAQCNDFTEDCEMVYDTPEYESLTKISIRYFLIGDGYSLMDNNVIHINYTTSTGIESYNCIHNGNAYNDWHYCNFTLPEKISSVRRS